MDEFTPRLNRSKSLIRKFVENVSKDFLQDSNPSLEFESNLNLLRYILEKSST